MKTTCLLFLTMTWAALTHEMGYAVPELVPCPIPRSVGENSALSPLGERAAYGNSALSPLGERVPRDGVLVSRRGTGEGVPTKTGQPAFSSARQPTGTVRSHLGAAPQKVNRPKQLPNSRQRFLSGDGTNLHQPGSNKSGRAEKSGFTRNETVNIAVAVRTPSVVRPSAPSLNNVRHRSPNPAVVGGAANSHRSNTAAISGTRMNRKP
jgi:hypothetical protein